MSETDWEKPAPDVMEQGREAEGEADAEAPLTAEPAGLPLDANEADAAEQRREVRLDEDEYR